MRPYCSNASAVSRLYRMNTNIVTNADLRYESLSPLCLATSCDRSDLLASSFTDSVCRLDKRLAEKDRQGGHTTVPRIRTREIKKKGKRKSYKKYKGERLVRGKGD